MEPQKIEVFDCPSLYDGVDSIVAELEARGFANMRLNVPMTIVLKSTGEVLDGQRVMNAFAYVAMSDDDIIEELAG